MRTWTLLALVVTATPAALAQTPVMIDFDDLTAPCDLGSAVPLSDEYIALGVVFSIGDPNGAAVLDECSTLGAPGFSPPNIAVIDPQASLATGGTPDTLSMQFPGAAPYRVGARVAGPPGTTIRLVCTVCPWSVPGCDVVASVTLGSAMQTIGVSSYSPFSLGCQIYSWDPVGPWIIDDLAFGFQQPAPEITQLSVTGVSITIALIAVLGAALIRRSINA